MKYQKVTKENPTESALDRRFVFTRFPDAHARQKREPRMSLRSFAARIPERVADSKAALPLVKLGRFGDEPTRKGSLRHNANMIAIEGVEGDYDGGKLSVERAAAKLRKADLSAVIYTSPSHRPEAPRWRVLCPTSRSMSPAERERLMARVNGALGGILAGESFTLSQTYYFGRIDGQPAPQVEIVEGRPVDLAHDLDAGALDKHGKSYGRDDDEPEDDEDSGLEPEPDLERIGKALAVIPSDERETWLTVGQALHHEFGGDEDGFALWDEWSQASAKYDEDDQRRVWDSFGSHVGRKIKIGTLYRLAKLHRPKREFGGLRILTTEDCAAAPPRGCLVEGLLAPGDMACIFGAPGAGKSLIAPFIGYQVALGETAFGMSTKPGVVLYVAAEDPHGMQGRVKALSERQGHAPDFLLIEGVSDLLDDESPDLESLLDVVRDREPALIFIDTLAMAFPGLEENDAKSMGRVVAISRQLAESGAAVVLIHHDTKAEGSTPRGHSILNGALDMAMHVKRDEDGIVRGKLTKNRNGSTERDIAFRIGVEELGENEFGNPITAALVEEMPRGTLQGRVRMTAGESAAIAKLLDLEADGRVTEEDWRAACIAEREVSGSEDVESRKRAMRRAVQGLAKKKLIATRGGFVASAEATSGDEECDDI
ncbi:MAG: AAA family ATPase [Proteobacteria bacterium]|nr:AAA family ATPase [Pseudomonadota bacterium]